MDDGIYIHLFHGRKSVDEELDDWGSDGPVIGPLRYVHGTYMSTLRCGAKIDVVEKFFPDEYARMKEFVEKHPQSSYFNDLDEIHDVWLKITEDLVEHDGVLYGDWSVGGSELKAEDFNAS